ncbi:MULTISPECIES: ABC transporter substrate-binding protein [unclassified Paenibacillus]|uniref:ABC transporter substrate-binding protein n=1 Tax=unclassified Paenibacillus TaxID=185978 RepID=UPI000BA6AA83|nr:ABC transporter substrate-binding protein [Paenibacillus sp. 7541]PAK53030.1 hypothetical protein CHH75_11425 [Paenibacillus sp. 7541]
MKRNLRMMLFITLLTLAGLITACGTGDTNNNASGGNNPVTSNNGASSDSSNNDNSSSGSQSGGSLVYAMANDVDGLDPQRTVSASTFLVTHNLFETLISVTPEGELVPQLATSWEPSEDELEWTFQLRDDAQFHNGHVMNAEDVIRSFERLRAADSPRAGEYANIADIRANGDHELVFTLASADATFLSQLANPWSAIVLEQDGDVIGTGPFKLVRYEPQQYIDLVKNESYYEEGKPYLDEARLMIIPNATTLLANLQSGTVHIGGITGAQLPQVEQLSHLKTQGAANNSVQLMAMNNDREPLNDVRVRQAIALAVNKQDVIDGATWGFGTPLGSHLPPLSSYFVDTLDVLPYNVDQAKELLAEAGYVDGLKLTLSLPEGYDTHINAGQIIADQLSRVGIELEIEIVEWGTWLEDIYAGRNYDLTVISHTGRLDPHAFLSRYLSDSSENYFNYVNEEVDQALLEAAVTSDVQKREELYSFIQQTLAEEVPALYLQSMEGITALHESVQQYESFPIGIINLKDVYLDQ